MHQPRLSAVAKLGLSCVSSTVQNLASGTQSTGTCSPHFGLLQVLISGAPAACLQVHGRYACSAPYRVCTRAALGAYILELAEQVGSLVEAVHERPGRAGLCGYYLPAQLILK